MNDETNAFYITRPSYMYYWLTKLAIN